MRWYTAAAEQGHAEAQNSVGSGLQADKKFAEARQWYEKAAGQNHALATNNLAYLYDLGLGVAQDRQRAFQLYSQAADLAWAEAMWNLANMYGAGQLGKPPDLVQACIRTLRASRFAGSEEHQLHAQVKRVTPMLERRLSSADMESCRQQAQAWSPPREKERIDQSRTGESQ
jgi:TPR repeat protein